MCPKSGVLEAVRAAKDTPSRKLNEGPQKSEKEGTLVHIFWHALWDAGFKGRTVDGGSRASF